MKVRRNGIGLVGLGGRMGAIMEWHSDRRRCGKKSKVPVPGEIVVANFGRDGAFPSVQMAKCLNPSEDDFQI